MARIRYLDYRAEDSTELLNNMLRGILASGVYLGYNVGTGGSGGWWLKFTHDTDPDNTGQVLGVIVTPDGVHLQEDANQDDVCQGSAPGGSDEIHWVVASYTYNKALPNNDVVYYVKTAVAPSTPSLTDDEVLIAEIDVPTGATSYGSAGVDIKTVAKKSLYDINIYNLFSKFADILDPGIYEGMETNEGSTTLEVNLEAGVWITQQSAKIVEASQQADLFTLTNPGNDFYRLAWVVGMHKNEDTDPLPSVDYLLVEGTAVAIGAEASLPTDAAILTAAQAVDAKYTSNDHINKLGYIRVENRSGTYVINYYRGETRMQEDTIIVYGANGRSPFSRSGKYFGHQGLLEAINDVYAITSVTTPNAKPYTILLDGDFQMADKFLTLPSHIKLKGYGASSNISSDESTVGVIRLAGFYALYDTTNPVVAQSTWGAGSPPTGFVARTFEIQPTYRVGEDLVAKMFSVGDPIAALGFSSFNQYEATFQGYDTSSNNWTFNLYIEDQYNLDGNPTDLLLAMYKRNIHLENLDIDRKTSAGDGLLLMNYVQDCVIDKVRARELDYRYCGQMHFGEFEVHNDLTWIGNSASKYDHLKINCPQTSINIGDSSEYDADFGIIEINTLGTVSTVTITCYDRSRIGKIIMQGGTASQLDIDAVETQIDLVWQRASGGDIDFQGAFSAIGYCQSDNDISITASNGNTVIVWAGLGGNLTISGGRGNKVLHLSTGSDTALQGFGEHANSDRNLRLVSNANIGWNSSTGALSWDDVLRFDNPWRSGYSEIAAGSATLSVDGDRLYVDINRGATGVSAVSTSVRDKANADLDGYYPDRVFVAVRFGGNIYLFDGTRIEDGQTVKVGSTPPPDGSVTYSKLAESALLFHNKFFRDYVCPDEAVDWPNEVVYYNNPSGTPLAFTYTAATGVIQFAGSPDLTGYGIRVGDTFLFRDFTYSPGVAGSGGYTRERILGVSGAATGAIVIAKGLSVTIGGAHRWQGSIVRGNIVVTNKALTTFTYTPGGANPGRVSFAAGLGFSQYQVVPGNIFIDADYRRWYIIARDTSGNGDWIEVSPGLTALNDTVPITEEIQGAIIQNNNPAGLKFGDLRVCGGLEFIPIDDVGEPDINDKRWLPFLEEEVPFPNRLPAFTRPYDSRVRVLQNHTGNGGNQYAPMYDDDDIFGDGALYARDNRMDYVCLTAVCTGAILIVGDWTGNSAPAWIDGEYVAPDAVMADELEANNKYGVRVNWYRQVGIGSGTDGIMGKCWRLPQGVHTFVWDTTQIDSVRGVILFNEMQDTAGLTVTDSPGTAIVEGGRYTLSQSARIGINRTPPSGWFKGSRHLRYIDHSRNFQWSDRYIRNFTGTGTTAAASTAITNVSNPSDWQRGDILMVVCSGGGSSPGSIYIGLIDNIVGTTINMNAASPVPFTDTATTLYYYGRSFQGTARTSAPTYIVGPHSREEEEVAARISLLDFIAGAQGDTSSDMTMGKDFQTNSQMLSDCGVRLSDLNTVFAFEGATNIYHVGDGLWVDSTYTGTMRIGFTGSGISIDLGDTSAPASSAVTVTLDGAPMGNISLPSMGAMPEDNGGTFFFGELPYGYHQVELQTVASSWYIKGFTIWQPAKPDLPEGESVLELWDTNVLARADSTRGGTPENGASLVGVGNIRYDWGSQLDVRNSAGPAVQVIQDISIVTAIANTTLFREWDWLAGGAVSGTYADFLFFGSEITLITSIVQGANFNILIQDHDGWWRAPGSTTGFTTSGATAIPIHATPGRRDRVLFDHYGIHAIRIVGLPASTNIRLDSVEIDTPYHVHKTKPPKLVCHFVPNQHAGADRRNMTPLEAHLVPKGQSVEASSWITFKDDWGDYRDQRPMPVWSNGGVVEVQLSATVQDSLTTSGRWELWVDHVPVCEALAEQTAVGTYTQVSFNVVLNLSPGMHFAYLVRAAGPGVSNVQSVQFLTRQISAKPWQSMSRGLTSPAPGMSQLNESSY